MTKPVRLANLLNTLQIEEPIQVPDSEVTGIEYDSRQVQPGNLFVAVAGGNSDGHRYIPDAITRGVSAVVGSQSIHNLTVPYIQVKDSRMALAKLSAAFYDFPAKKMVMIGVTGTDGKTTTASLIYNILQAAGLKTGIITTVNAVIGDEALDTGFHVTTPQAPEVQHLLAKMVDAGISHVILEATSHGLAQSRVAECYFDIGVITNITPEHLDYHGTFEAYRAAKGRLFASLSGAGDKKTPIPAAAVLNRDDPSYDYLKKLSKAKIYSYGLNPSAGIWAEDIRMSPGGLRFDVIGLVGGHSHARLPISTSLVGGFNIYNCLAAITVAGKGLNLPAGPIQRGIANLAGVPGRMERVDLNLEYPGIQNFTAMVDFAHTPNALQSALEAARLLTSGKIIAVFGSAGLRDRAKRRKMAEIAAQLADFTILTAEDPRSESLEEILRVMASGAEAKGGIEGQTFWRIPDRRDALRFAVSLANSGDVVITCGKGHEQSMCFGETEYAWDDRTALRAALAELYGIPGFQMPYLPG